MRRSSRVRRATSKLLDQSNDRMSTLRQALSNMAMYFGEVKQVNRTYLAFKATIEAERASAQDNIL